MLNTLGHLVLNALVFLTAATAAQDIGKSLTQLESDFQHDADTYRARHLGYYVKLIEEFKEKTGRYPLQGDEKRPIWTHVANSWQLKNTRPGPSYAHVRVPFAEWVRDVEEGLGREIDELYDPQLAPVGRPNFYVYVLSGDQYFMSVYVSESLPFAREEGPKNYKIAVSNICKPDDGHVGPKDLLASKEFSEVTARPLVRDGLLIERENYFLHATKHRKVPAREEVTPK